VGCGGKGLKIIEEISAVVAASLCTICSLSLPSYSRPSLPKESFDGFVRSARVLENHSCVFCSHGDCVCFVGSVLLTRIRRQQTITVQFHSWLDLRGRAGRLLGPLKYCATLNIYLSIIFSYLIRQYLNQPKIDISKKNSDFLTPTTLLSLPLNFTSKNSTVPPL
jgi:hypothetical protein